MYIREELNPQPRFTSPQQRYSMPSPSHYQNNIPKDTPPKDFDARPSRKISNELPKNTFTPPSHKDGLLAQLIDMGFDVQEARIALAASPNNTNLQDLLDLILQNKDQKVPDSSDEDEETERRKEEAWRKEKEERRRDYLESERRKEQAHRDYLESERRKEQAHRDYLESERRKEQQQESEQREAKRRSKQDETQQDRKQGNLFFNRGQFAEAERFYTKAIVCLSFQHPDLVLLYNNRAAARLKLGLFDGCLEDCTHAVAMASKNTVNRAELTEGVSSWTSQWLKALHRKACALEGLKKYEEAIGVYEEYARLDGTRSSVVTQGISRCQQANPANGGGPSWRPAQETTAFPDIDFNIFVPQQPNRDEINASKAVKEMREREKKREAEEAERLEKTDAVNAQLMTWKLGKEKNLRALLGSLELILWSSIQWKSVSMSELLEPRKCKLTYMKAIAKVHPDKLSSNATIEQRLLASGIFTTLNQAWDTFRTENNL
ncbi:unnamed protein product [Rhizopus stolonifer]